MILVPLTFNVKQKRMQTDRKNAPDRESKDQNQQESHDPVQSGQQAIEASKLNEQNKTPVQRQEEETRDAAQWRDEG